MTTPSPEVPAAELSPRAVARGLTAEDTYYDFDTKMREPKIDSTVTAWETGLLGADARYVRKVTDAEVLQVADALKAS